MLDFVAFNQNLDKLRQRIDAACAACCRNAADVAILPVTKNHPLDAAVYAAKCGFKSVGENRVQEASEKMAQAAATPNCPAAELMWELIGHLQTNKARHAAERFARIQSVDSVKLLKKLDSAAREIGKKQRILLQINAGRDPAKFGAECEDAPALLEAALGLENISVEGLMTIAPLDENPDTASRCFENLRLIRDSLSEKFNTPLKELSMGMTHDLERAITEGSTMIRVGTFLYGERIYAKK